MEIGYVIAFLLGGLFFSIVVYFCMRDQYTKKIQKRKIAHFITGMKRLKKSGKTDGIEKAIKTFSECCLSFDRKSFTDFKTPEFDAIADILLSYDNESLPYPNGNGMEVPIIADTSKNVKNLIEEALKKIIYA